MKPLHSVILGGAVCALACPSQAQNVIGFSAGADISYIDRINANTFAADALNHYDTRDYMDWMLDPADPTGATMKFLSLRLIVQDQVGTTPESFTVVGYTEDPLNPDYPNQAGAWFRTGAINLPASTATGPVAWIYTITPTVPAAPKGDAWIGIGLNAGTWPTDGIAPHVTFDRTPAFTTGALRDLAGNGINSMTLTNTACAIPTNANVPSGPAIYPSAASGRRQIWIELKANVAGGVPVTQTNQTIFPSSNPGGTNPLVPLGGTTDMFSGLNPDVYDHSLQTPARQDDIGFLVNDASVPNAPVFVLIAFGGSPIGSVPLTSLMGPSANPATKGNVCVDFTTAATYLGFSNATGVMQLMLSLSAGTRLAFQGLTPIDVWYQGFVLNGASSPGLEVHATGCGVQHL